MFCCIHQFLWCTEHQKNTSSFMQIHAWKMNAEISPFMMHLNEITKKMLSTTKPIEKMMLVLELKREWRRIRTHWSARKEAYTRAHIWLINFDTVQSSFAQQKHAHIHMRTNKVIGGDDSIYCACTKVFVSIAARFNHKLKTIEDLLWYSQYIYHIHSLQCRPWCHHHF